MHFTWNVVILIKKRFSWCSKIFRGQLFIKPSPFLSEIALKKFWKSISGRDQL